MSARRPIFNHLVAPLAGGPVFHDEAKQMLDTYRDEVRREDGAELLRIKAALLDLHPKTAEPRHGCCAAPKLCNGHRPECRSREHTIGGMDPWPCATLRAAGITCDEDAAEVRRLVENPRANVVLPAKFVTDAMARVPDSMPVTPRCPVCSNPPCHCSCFGKEPARHCPHQGEGAEGGETP